MANLKSSKKDIRLSEKRRAQNQGVKTSLKTFVKKVKKADSPESAQVALVTATKALDKAVQNGVIHKKQAARRKSRAAKAASKVVAAAPVAAKKAVAEKPAVEKAPKTTTTRKKKA